MLLPLPITVVNALMAQEAKIDEKRQWRYELRLTPTATLISDGEGQSLQGKNIDLSGSLSAKLYDSEFLESSGKPHILVDYTFGSDYRGLNDKNRNAFTLELRSPKGKAIVPKIPFPILYRVRYDADEGSSTSKEFTVGFRGEFSYQFQHLLKGTKNSILFGFDLGERFGSGTTEASLARFVGESSIEVAIVPDRLKLTYQPSIYLNTTNVGDRSDFYHSLGLTYNLFLDGDLGGKPRSSVAVSLRTGNGRKPSGFKSESKTQLGLVMSYRF